MDLKLHGWSVRAANESAVGVTEPLPVSLRGEVDTRTESLWSATHRSFVVGSLALVTLAAFENRAVSTLLPTAAAELNGMALFGAATAVTLIAYVVAASLSGPAADHRGPGVVLKLGVSVFVFAQVAGALAPNMWWLVASRFTSGAAEALLDIALTVLLARALPAALRPKAMGLFAVAWILPSLAGPPVAGLMTEQLGWRLALVAPSVLVVPAWLALRPTLRAHGVPAQSAELLTTGVSRSAVGLIAGALTVLCLLGPLVARGWWALAICLLLVSVAALVPPLRRLLPAGTLRGAPGLPATIAVRALIGASFLLAGAFLPLMFTVLLGLSPTIAGLSLSVTGVSWALGSYLNGRDSIQQRMTVSARVRVGGALIVVGAVGPMLAAVGWVPTWLCLALWAAAGLGIGICSPTLATHQLDLSPEHRQGRDVSSMAVLSATLDAVAAALAGLAIAMAGASNPLVFVGIVSMSMLMALAAFGMASRLQTR